jgi:hypothetical protein
MDALPFRFPVAQQLRVAAVGNVIDADAAAKLRRRIVGIVEVELLIDDHQVAAHAHLVGMRARLHPQFGEHLRVLRIAHIDNRRAEGRAHVADIGKAVLDDDLAAAGAIDIADLLQPRRLRHAFPPYRPLSGSLAETVDYFSH